MFGGWGGGGGVGLEWGFHSRTTKCAPYLERNTYMNRIISFLGDGTVCTGGEKDRKLLTWDSAREFEKRLEIKLPDGVGSARSLTKQTIDQVSI